MRVEAIVAILVLLGAVAFYFSFKNTFFTYKRSLELPHISHSLVSFTIAGVILAIAYHAEFNEAKTGSAVLLALVGIGFLIAGLKSLIRFFKDESHWD